MPIWLNKLLNNAHWLDFDNMGFDESPVSELSYEVRVPQAIPWSTLSFSIRVIFKFMFIRFGF